jgi:hypothetical protein
MMTEGLMTRGTPARSRVKRNESRWDFCRLYSLQPTEREKRGNTIDRKRIKLIEQGENKTDRQGLF